MTYLDLSKPNLTEAIILKEFESYLQCLQTWQSGTEETTCIKNVKFKVIKITTGCQYVGYFYYSENLNWPAQNLRLGRGLDIAELNK